MPALTLNPSQTINLDKAASLIEVAAGSVSVTTPDGTTSRVWAENSIGFGEKGQAGLTLHSIDSARIAIYYVDEKTPAKPEPSSRGDAGGSGGSFESRTDKELRKIAAEREIPGRSNMNKAQLIEALRA